MKRKNVVTIVAVIVVAVVAFFLVNSNNHSNSSENKQSTKSSSTNVAKSEKSSSASSSSSDSTGDSSHIQILKGSTKTVAGLKIKLNDVKATNLTYPGGKLAQYDMTITNTKSKDMYVLADALRGGVFSTGIKGEDLGRGLYTVLKGPDWWISETDIISNNGDKSGLNSIDWISSKFTQDKNIFFGTDAAHSENYLVWKLEPGQTISGSALGDGETKTGDFSDAMLVVNPDNMNMSKSFVDTATQYLKDKQQHNGQ